MPGRVRVVAGFTASVASSTVVGRSVDSIPMQDIFHQPLLVGTFEGAMAS